MFFLLQLFVHCSGIQYVDLSNNELRKWMTFVITINDILILLHMVQNHSHLS